MHSNKRNRHEEYRYKLLGLGESSLRKNYYPELRKHMREVEESRERYKAIFNATADGLFIHDAITFEILDVNEQGCQMFGYTIDELKELDIGELSTGIPPYSMKEAEQHIRQTIDLGMQNIEWQCRRKNGGLFWTDVCLKSATIGGRHCVIASVRDVSERKLLEEKLRHSQKMEAVGQLSGGIAHDFNNMLSGIIGATELIRHSPNTNDEINELTDIILNAANTAANLTTKLLSFSRKGAIERHNLHIHTAIQNAVEILKRSIDRKIRLNLNLQASDDNVLGDQSLIENLIINMSLNARDAMPEGGTLSLLTENYLLPASEIPENFSNAQGKAIRIVISDTGIGIPDEIITHIFDPFFTTKQAGKGTGLGLSAVYGAVQSHNGLIKVESEPGKGSTFSIYLPLTDPMGHHETKSDELTIKGSGKILVIDDEAILRTIAESMLEEMGYEVCTAEDGEAGVESFKNNKPDLVLLDMVMPKMSSVKCFTLMKDINPDIPIIAISGYACDTSIDTLFAKGLSGFLKKPYRIKELSKMISATLKAAKH